MEICTIEPRWNHKYANDPDIEVLVDKFHPWDAFLYKNTEGTPDHTMLISTNCDPWVRFVYIENPQGDPTFYGALGGKYRIEGENEEFISRTGWSSRAGVINRDYANHLKEEIVEVSVLSKERSYPRMAGYYIYVSALRNNPAWPNGLHLVRHIKFRNEPYWTISVDPYEVVKAPQED